MLETLDWYQISWNLVLPIHVMDQVEVVHVKYHLGITYSPAVYIYLELHISHYSQGDFSANSITINGWLRKFLWSQASQVIQSYALSICVPYGLIFLIAHFICSSLVVEHTGKN